MSYKYVDDIGRIVNEQLDIVTVVGERVALKKSGRSLKGLCPFHSEKTPSFFVDSQKQFFHCFGCGKKGNALTFIMEYENLDFLTALESASDRYSIDLDPYRTNQNEKRFDSKPYFEINKRAAVLYYNNLKKNRIALEYLQKRGISQETITHFGLGYSEDSWDSLLAHEKHTPKEVIQSCGLFLPKKSGGFYDRFRDRIMFPIIDLRKRVVGFGARILGDGVPKYLNSPESPVFNKSFLLFGLNRAKDYLTEDGILLVEGYMDVIGLYEQGIKNAVASLGTSFTTEQAKLLKRYVSQVTILYDGDEAGQKATEKAVEILIEQSLNCYIVTLPQGNDPDEYILEYGKDQFEQYIAQYRQDQWMYLLELAKKKVDLKQITGQRLFLEEAVTILKRITNGSVRNMYLNKISEEMGVTTESLIRDLNAPVKKKKTNIKKDSHLREKLLSIMIHQPEIIVQIKETFLFELLPNQIQTFLCLIIDKNGYNRESVLNHFNLDEAVYFDQIRQLKVSDGDRKNWKVLFKRFADEMITDKINEIRESSIDRNETLKQVQVLQTLRTKLIL